MVLKTWKKRRNRGRKKHTDQGLFHVYVFFVDPFIVLGLALVPVNLPKCSSEGLSTNVLSLFKRLKTVMEHILYVEDHTEMRNGATQLLY